MKYNVSMKEKVVTKIVTNWLFPYRFSIFLYAPMKNLILN